ncbi:MAG: hypothetical protein QW655_03250 [Nitrososphaerota archaeon]|nr:hypothetical protein [Candidatus Geocrenenecus dongiae]
MSSRAYVLRIASLENEELVYGKRCYYTNLRRKFSPGDMVFFLMKKEVDSFIGYGVIEVVKELAEIDDPEEREFCIRNKWYTKIEFSEIHRFQLPLPLRLVFPGLHRLGRALHGLELNPIEVKRILDLEQICIKDRELWEKYIELSKKQL